MDNLTRFFVAVKALIVSNGKFLIIRRSSQARHKEGAWDFPGGRLEFGESAEDALIREVSEEVGLDISYKRIIGSWTFMKNESTQVVGLTFLCKTLTDKVILSHEHDDFIWISEQEIDKYLSEEVANALYKLDLCSFLIE